MTSRSHKHTDETLHSPHHAGIARHPASRRRRQRTRSDEPSPTNSSISASADYYHYDYKNDDNGLDLFGGTVEYNHALRQGSVLHFSLTALSGSEETTYRYGTLNEYSRTHSDDREFRLSTLYTPSSVSWLAFGVEYINDQRDYDTTRYGVYKHLVDKGTPGRPDLQWDGTYYTKESSPSADSLNGNELYLKSTITCPEWQLYRGTRSALTLAPSLDAEVGYMWGDDATGSKVYIASAKAKLVYEFGSNTLFLEGGYRYLGSFESGDGWVQSYFGRAGYSYRW